MKVSYKNECEAEGDRKSSHQQMDCDVRHEYTDAIVNSIGNRI